MWTATDAPATGGGDPIGWVNYGILGLLVAGAIAGLIYFKPSVQDLKEQVRRAEADRDAQVRQLREERDKAIAQRDQMAETFQREWLPMLTRFLASSEAILPLLQRMAHRDRHGGDDQ